MGRSEDGADPSSRDVPGAEGPSISSSKPGSDSADLDRQDEVLGLLAVERGLLNQEGLEACLREIRESRARGEKASLGEILVRRRALTNESLIGLLREPARGAGESIDIPRYEIRERLGEGASAVVYHAWDRELQRPVALKLLREASSMSQVARERFRREARAAGALSHPNVVQVHDVGEVSGRFYIVLELVVGKPLADEMKGGAPREALLSLLEKAARGVAAAHEKGIVHRDIKPANILVGPSGEAKVGDFGLAHLSDSSLELTRSGSTLGTPLYMSPEQVRGDTKEITPRTDVYALGAILYEILSGRPPHVGETLAEIYEKVLREETAPPRPAGGAAPGDLGTVAMKALDKEPARRYPTAAEFASDLRRAIDGEPIEARPEGRVRRFWRRARRARWAVSGALALAMIGLVATGFAILRHDRKRELAAQSTGKARDFARAHPEDLEGQLPLWKDALLAAQGTQYEADARRDHDALVLRRRTAVAKDLADLDLAVAALEARKEYGAARAALDSALRERSFPEWAPEIDRRIAAQRDRISKERARAEELARAARERGSEDDVSRLRSALERWGLRQELLDFDRALSAVPVPRPLADPALCGYWALDEGAGRQAADASGKRPGRIAGAAWVPGKFGTALRFDGQRSVLELPSTPELDRLQEGNYTIAAWVKVEDVPRGSEPYGLVMKPGRHMGLGFGQNGRFFVCRWLKRDQIQYVHCDSGRTFLPDGEFHHVAGVVDRDSGVARVYVDGVRGGDVRSEPGAASIDYGHAPWRIGCADPALGQDRYAARAVIDEVRFYARALDEAEVGFLYRARPVPASSWMPVFDGATTGFLSRGSLPFWKAEDGALVQVPDQKDPQSGQSRDEFGDGEFRFRFSFRGPVNVISCTVREGTARAVFYRPAVEAMGEGEHEVVLTCLGGTISGTLDGKPVPLEVQEPVRPRGRLQFNSYGGDYRLLSLDARTRP